MCDPSLSPSPPRRAGPCVSPETTHSRARATVYRFRSTREKVSAHGRSHATRQRTACIRTVQNTSLRPGGQLVILVHSNLRASHGWGAVVYTWCIPCRCQQPPSLRWPPSVSSHLLLPVAFRRLARRCCAPLTTRCRSQHKPFMRPASSCVARLGLRELRLDRQPVALQHLCRTCEYLLILRVRPEKVLGRRQVLGGRTAGRIVDALRFGREQALGEDDTKP